MLGFLLASCGGGSGDGSGSGQCGGGACGGDIVGTWVVQSVCIDVGELNAQLTSQLPPECRNLVKSASVSADVTTTYDADGTVSTSGSMEIYATYDYTADCLRAQGTEFSELSSSFCQQVAESAEQAANEDGDVGFEFTCMHQGNSCRCENKTSVEVTETATYSVSGSDLTEDGEVSDYCVEGNTLTVSGGPSGATGSYTATRQ